MPHEMPLEIIAVFKRHGVGNVPKLYISLEMACRALACDGFEHGEPCFIIARPWPELPFAVYSPCRREGGRCPGGRITGRRYHEDGGVFVRHGLSTTGLPQPPANEAGRANERENPSLLNSPRSRISPDPPPGTPRAETAPSCGTARCSRRWSCRWSRPAAAKGRGLRRARRV